LLGKLEKMLKCKKPIPLLLILLLFYACVTEVSDEVSTTEKPADKIESKKVDCFEGLSLDTSIGNGCGDIFLFQVMEEGILTVQIDPEKIALDSNCKYFKIQDGLKIEFEIYPENAKIDERIQPYCSCFRSPGEPNRIHVEASNGVMIANTTSETGERIKQISALLKELEFEHPESGKVIFIEEALFWNVAVGWRAG